MFVFLLSLLCNEYIDSYTFGKDYIVVQLSTYQKDTPNGVDLIYHQEYSTPGITFHKYGDKVEITFNREFMCSQQGNPFYVSINLRKVNGKQLILKTSHFRYWEYKDLLGYDLENPSYKE